MTWSTQVWTVSTVFVELLYHDYRFLYPSAYISQSPWFNGSLDRLVTFCQTQDASYSILYSVPVAYTCKHDGSHDSSQPLPHFTPTLMDRARNVLTGTSVLRFKADLTLWTDASSYELGAHLGDLNVSGKCSVMKHIIHKSVGT